MTRNTISALAILGLSLTFSQVALAGPSKGLVQGPLSVSNLLGDANGDCLVDTNDLLDVLAAVGGDSSDEDMNRDGEVDSTDIAIVEAQWGAICSDRLAGDVDGNGLVNVEDMVELFSDYDSVGGASDLDGSGLVDDNDLDFMLANWGSTFGQRILGDVTGDAAVDSLDITMALSDVGSKRTRSDVNGDGAVDSLDIDLIRVRYGATASTSLTGDVNGDGLVDDVDVDLVHIHLGNDWPQADFNQDGVVTERDLSIILAANGDSSAQRLTGDISGDGVVDSIDQALLAVVWGGDYPQADVDGDGTIGLSDLMGVLAAQGESYGSSLTGDVDGSCEVDQTDVDLISTMLGTTWAPADLNGDGQVTQADFLSILGNVGLVCE